VQEAGQQGVGHVAYGAAHALDADGHPMGGEAYPASVAAPKDTRVLGAAVRAALGTHLEDPGSVLRLVVLDGADEAADNGHGDAGYPLVLALGRERSAATPVRPSVLERSDYRRGGVNRQLWGRG